MDITSPAALVTTIDAPQNEWTLEQLGVYCRSQSRKTASEAWKLGRALLLVKAKLKHGAFKPWLREHCPGLGYATLARYMQLARLHATPDDLAEQNVTESYQRAAITDAAARRAQRRTLIGEAVRLCGQAHQCTSEGALRKMLADLDEILKKLLPKKRPNSGQSKTSGRAPLAS